MKENYATQKIEMRSSGTLVTVLRWPHVSELANLGDNGDKILKLALGQLVLRFAKKAREANASELTINLDEIEVNVRGEADLTKKPVAELTVEQLLAEVERRKAAAKEATEQA
jgi:hypothetical protein